MRAACTAGCLVAALLLGACGERPQTASARKSDAPPSQGAAQAYMASGWKAGDAVSWETQLKKRTEGQNEYARTRPN